MGSMLISSWCLYHIICVYRYRVSSVTFFAYADRVLVCMLSVHVRVRWLNAEPPSYAAGARTNKNLQASSAATESGSLDKVWACMHVALLLFI